MGQSLPGLGAAAGLLAAALSPCTFSGSLSASAATANVTGTSRTVTVPVDNSGQVQVRNLVIGATGNPQISANGAAYGTIGESDILTFANGESIQARCRSMTSPEIVSFDLYDVDTDTLIVSFGSVTFERT